MDLLPSDDQLALVDASRELLADRCSMERVGAAHESDTGRLDDLWAAASEQGWFAVGLPEDRGGLGLSIVETMLLFELLGEFVAPGPWLGTTVGALALAETPWGERLAAGAPVALGLDLRGAAPPPTVVGAAPRGTLPRVEDAVDVDALLVVFGNEIGWVEGASVATAESIDPGRRLARVELDGATVAMTGIDVAAFFEPVHLLIAAEAVGVAEGALRVAVQYALDREQFGRPIGSFQAIKHRLADAKMSVERARSLVYLTAVKAAEGDLGPGDVEAARLLATETARSVTAAAISVHGALGYTVECDAHLFWRRARTLEQCITGPAELAETVAATL